MSSVKITGNASGTGVFTVESPNSNTDRTLTLPDEAGTVLTSAGPIDVDSSAPDDSLSITSSGIVGVNTTTPGSYSAGGSNFVVAKSSSGSNAVGMSLVNPNGAVGTSVSLEFVPNTNIALASISSPRTAANGACDLAFNTYTGSSMTEKMRITSDGKAHVGLTNGGSKFNVESSTNIAQFRMTSSSASQETNLTFIKNGSEVGYVNCTTSSTVYGTSSDHRLKENVVDMSGAIDRVKTLLPKRFNFIIDADTTVDGFLAI